MGSKDSYYGDLQKALIGEKVMSAEDLHEALMEAEHGKKSLIDAVFEKGKFDEKKLARVLSKEFGYTLTNPTVFIIDDAVIASFPKEVAEKYTALAISQHEKTLTVAFANPTNLAAIDEIHAITGLRIRACVAGYATLRKLIEKYYSLKKTDAPDIETEDRGGELDDLVKMIDMEDPGESAAEEAELAKVAHESPTIKIVNMVLLEGIKRKASDIFIEPWENFVRVRVRVDGMLEELIKAPVGMGPAIVSRVKIMSDLNIAEHRVPQDGRIKVRVEKRSVDLRVSILPSSFGEKVCLRILDTSNQGHDITKLGFSDREQQIIKDCSRKPHGMILVTGPTGSGKSTTLYSVLKFLDKPEVNITTVEEPVEYQVHGINQVNVKEAIGLTFPAALRSILRQDPDIVLIGEIRDTDTLDIAVKAAMTGHLVLSTLHTNDAPSSITRMVNMGLEPFLIASTVIMVSAQRLVRRICQRCRYTYEAEADLVKDLGLDPAKTHQFYKAKGCVRCRQSGYQGRRVITEIMEMTPTVMAGIMQGASSDDLKAIAVRQGMTTLRQSAVAKALEGETTVEEIYRVSTNDQKSEEKKAA
ncbi:MAG: ATPase, T2SS/T4P/T4SS family [Candidatus Omnitrophota bacterium]|nr:ATPase, T2SS/T4P/T4SS family [Candidatus Omnitrophota bacterium]